MKSTFKMVYQHDTMQCGVAALAMVCKYYGLTYKLSEIEAYCKPTVEGVSLKAIADAASEIGFKSKCVQMTMDEIEDFNMPMILHWNQNHYVVLYDISHDKNYYKIADPGKGRVKYKLNEFKERWICSTSDGVNTGVAIVLTPERIFRLKEKQQAGLKSISFLHHYIRQYHKYFIHIVIGLLIGCLLQLIMPFLTQAIVDIGIKHKDVPFIWLVLIGEFVIVLGRAATDFTRRWFLLHISMRINI